MDKHEIISEINFAKSEILQLIASGNALSVNAIPFAGSWTTAELVTHVTKSIIAMAQAMAMKGELAKRDPAARAQELKEMFLNFSVKYQSPAFILPDSKEYKKEAVTAALENSLLQFNENAAVANMAEVISLPGFGEITKMELLHFVLYHTQRHLHQLKNIVRYL